MSAGLFIAGIIAKDLSTIRGVRNDPVMLAKAADKYGIPVEQATFYLDAEIRAKEAGK